MSAPVRIAVVGAGISGLSTHWFLEQESKTTGCAIHVETWDPRPAVGGNIETAKRDGWLCESAAESILNSRTETRDLAESLGLGPRIVQVSAAASKRFLLWDGKLRGLKPGPGVLFGSFPTWKARIRALLEPFQPRGPQDESVAEFVTRRLGPDMLEQVVDPMVTGIFAASPDRLSILSAMPKLKLGELEHGSLVRAMFRSPKKTRSVPRDPSRPRTGSYTFQGGMTELVGALAAHLTGPVHSGKQLRSMEPTDSGWWLTPREGEREHFDHVVLALPVHEALAIEGLPESCRTVLGQVRVNPVAVVGLGFKRDQVRHPLDGFGFLVPRHERRNILGTLFSSTLWPHAAPSGHVLLRTMVGGGRQPELASLPEADLVALVRSELGELLGVQGEPVFQHIRVYAHGIPEYPVGHSARVTALREELTPRHLHLAGNTWDGVGLNDCVAAAAPRARLILQS